MTWTAFHRRADLLREIAGDADRTAYDEHRHDLPWARPGVAESFHGRLDLVGALQLRWHTALSARIEAELDRRPRDLADAVRRAWAATAQDHRGIRALLDRQLVAPDDDEIARALARAETMERAILARAAGLPSAAGATLEQRARVVAAGAVDQPAPSPRPTSPPSGSAAFVERLKAALAAA